MTENIIIVGAPRSGTNMLRDVLTGLPGIATWPCDEVNLFWKHHNRDFPSDELTPSHATPAVRRYMDKRFANIARRYDAHTVVEKTCATSLRVAFTATVMPDAKFLFIRRDGVDAAASTMRRWNAPLDLGYVAKKLRWAPPADLPFYGGRFVSKQLASRRAQRTADSGVTTTRKVESWWGPRPQDFRELQEHHPLDELAMIQWRRCVESSLRDLADLPADRVHGISYEDFVTDPATQLDEVLRFMDKSHLMDASIVSGVSSASIGKGRAALGSDTVRRLTEIGLPTLAKLGYA